MATPAVRYEVRYRLAGGDDAWVAETHPASSTISLPNLTRGGVYAVQLRAVDAAGNVSPWAATTVTVGDTNRTGAAALPNAGNQISMWGMDTSVTFAAATNEAGESVATISVSAGTLVMGSNSYSYGASSGTVTGAAGETKTIYLYYDDPEFLGGTLPLGITEDIVETANVDGRIAIPGVTITFPAAGGSSSGGGSAGGGGGSGGSGRGNQQQQMEL